MTLSQNPVTRQDLEGSCLFISLVFSLGMYVSGLVAPDRGGVRAGSQVVRCVE